MVSITKEKFLESISTFSFPASIDASSFESILKEYPAFNSAYLLESAWLNQNDKISFEKKIPHTAVNVRDRVILHDFIYKENFETKPVQTSPENETKETTSIEPEVIIENMEVKQVTTSEPLEINEKEVPEIEIIENEPVIKETREEAKDSNKADSSKETIESLIERIKSKTLEKVIEENKSLNKNQSIVIEQESSETPKEPIEKSNDHLEIDEKEAKRKNAMNTLQEELFGGKLSSDGKPIDAKEQRRVEAMQKLQEELFEAKKASTNKINKTEIESTTAKTDDSLDTTKEKNVENEKTEATVLIPLEQKIEADKEALQTKKEIKALIKIQEDIIKNIVQPEIFKEKDEAIDFIDWLKLKKTASKTEVVKSIKPKSKPKIEEVEKEDLIPFERTSVLEAEMHQEIKQSADPLESFISSEIVRKKKRRKVPNEKFKEADNATKNVIVSETLAEILTIQQKYSDAIDVYTLLSLKYPQKSIYFANQIEKIKNYL